MTRSIILFRIGAGLLLTDHKSDYNKDNKEVIAMAKLGNELDLVLEKASKIARKKAKCTGTPLFYMENGRRIKEYPDGKKFVLIVDTKGNVTEVPL